MYLIIETRQTNHPRDRVAKVRVVIDDDEFPPANITELVDLLRKAIVMLPPSINRVPVDRMPPTDKKKGGK